MAVRRLTWTRPSRGWLDALPLGDGRTGVMVRTQRDGVHLDLNDGTAWSGALGSEHRHGRVGAVEAREARQRARALFETGEVPQAEAALSALQSRYAQAYLPFADVVVEHDAAAGLRRTLDLAEGLHTAVIGEVEHRTFVSVVDGVVVHRLSAPVPLDVVVRVSTPLRELERWDDGGEVGLSLRLPADVAPTHEPGEPPLRWEAEGVEPLAGALALRFSHDGRLEATDAGADGSAGLRLAGVTCLELFIATQTTFAGLGRPTEGDAHSAAERARSRLVVASRTGAATLEHRHRGVHRELFARSGLEVSGCEELCDPDTRLGEEAARDAALVEALFDYGRYLLLASSRPGGLPATLQGLWNDEMQPPWSSAYTVNINTQMNYWAAGPLGLAEATEPLLELTEALADRGRETAWRLYGARGWVAHHNTDAWAYTSPVGGDASWAQWPMGGAWLVCELGRLRRFGQTDRGWDTRLWPLAAGAAEFVLDMLHERDGHLVSFPSTSPENRYLTPYGPASLTVGSAMDRALAADLFALVTELAADLGRAEEPLVAEVRAAAARLRPPALTPAGTVQEWGHDPRAEDPQHRHLSHLVFAYPGTADLHTGDGRLARAVARTLDERGDDSTGWSLVWKLALRARLGDGERFGELLRYLTRPADDTVAEAGGLYPNLFAAHPPFQIDANLGFPAAVCEALLQSHRGEIELLPAVPPALASGAFHGWLARPGLRVDLSWRGGVPSRLTLSARTPQHAGAYTVRHGGTRHRLTVPPEGSITVDWTTTPTHLEEHPAR